MSSGTDFERVRNDDTGAVTFSNEPNPSTQQIEETVIPEEPQKELTEDELVTSAFMEFEQNFRILRNKAAFMDRNALNRVLMALIGFPVANDSINLVKKQAEKEFLLMALSIRKPLALINEYVTKKHNLETQAAHNLADKVIEANEEFRKPKQEEGETNNEQTQASVD